LFGLIEQPGINSVLSLKQVKAIAAAMAFFYLSWINWETARCSRQMPLKPYLADFPSRTKRAVSRVHYEILPAKH